MHGFLGKNENGTIFSIFGFIYPFTYNGIDFLNFEG